MNLLSAIIWIPFIAALALALVPRSLVVVMRAGAVAATFLSAVLAVILFLAFQRGAPGYFCEQQIPWVDRLGISFHIGVDGLNIGLILMGAIVAFAAACASWEIQDRQKGAAQENRECMPASRIDRLSLGVRGRQ